MSKQTTEKKTWCDSKLLKKYQKTYGQSSKGNFSVVDTVPVPHAYMITEKHLRYNDSMYLGKDQIESMESVHGAMCGYKCNLKYEEHQSALLIGCKIQMKTKTGKAVKELQDFLLKNKKQCEKDKIAGFAFLDQTKDGEKK